MLLATRAAVKADINALRQRAALLTQSGSIKLPGFRERLEQFQAYAPPSAASSPILSDDFAPVEGLVGTAER